MRLTPLDIRHKEFRSSLRGYSEQEVDVFLDEVADEFERLFKENIDLSERLENATERVRSYQDIEQTLQNTLVTAQRSAEDIVAQARKESDLVTRDADLKAKEIIQGALGEKQKVQAELMRIKRAEGEFRGKLRAMLEEYLAGMQEITLPADMMSGDSVAPVAPQPLRAPEPVVEAGVQAEAVDVIEETEPAVSGEVRSVTLGEVGDVDLGPAEPVFTEPAEFQMPSFGSLGEADEEIEEID
jgi:cell division initiation protein